MFTGIIEAIGIIEEIEPKGSNKTFWIHSSISNQLKIDQSVSHNGVCLTVEEIAGNSHRVTAIKETLDKTAMGLLIKQNKINLERCLQFNGRLDGHMVQGHVDSTGVCTDVEVLQGSWVYQFQFPVGFAGLVVEKGSISLNGISLTIFDVSNNSFKVAIIPYTFDHTNMQDIKKGSIVNFEFDIIGKYVQRNQLFQREA